MKKHRGIPETLYTNVCAGSCRLASPSGAHLRSAPAGGPLLGVTQRMSILTPETKWLRIPALLFVCFNFLISPPVMADSDHFVVEPFTGVNLQHSSTDNKSGFESGVLFGIGGKFKGFPPRFFLYFRSSYSFFGDETITNDDYSTSFVHRSYTRLTGGLRIIIPLFSQLRMNLEVGGGKIFTYTQYDPDGIHTGSYEDTMGILELGAGLNYRIFHWLSVGLITNYAMVLDGRHNDRYGLYYNSTNPNWISLTASLGFHF